MARNDGWREGEASETGAVGGADNTSGTAKGHLPPFTAQTFQALVGNQQFSFLDPNVMMMTNAAATIAAVAASAVQQMNQGANTQAPAPAVNGNASASLSPALLASLRNLAAAQANSGSSISPQVAAILAAVGGGGGGVSNHGLQLQGMNSAVNHNHNGNHGFHFQSAGSTAPVAYSAVNHNGNGNHGLQFQGAGSSAPAANSAVNHNHGNHGLQLQGVGSSAPAASHLHRFLNKESSPTIRPPKAPSSLALGAASSSNNSGMQNWNAAQLGKTNGRYRCLVIEARSEICT
jgi:hypothetical protein